MVFSVLLTAPPNFLEMLLGATMAPILHDSLPISAHCFTELTSSIPYVRLEVTLGFPKASS